MSYWRDILKTSFSDNLSSILAFGSELKIIYKHAVIFLSLKHKNEDKMNKMLAALVGTLLSSGIANANDNYIPILYNLSTIFDFNPVKGPIRSLEEHVVANGKETQEIKLEFNNDFCVKNLTINRPTENYSLQLKLKGGVLEGKKMGSHFP